MFTCGPALLTQLQGDHPPGDGLTALQTAFAGASSVDLSPYARGAGTNSDPGTVVVSDGELTVAIGGSVERSLSWSGSNLARLPSTGYTAEYFVQAVETSVNPVSAMSRGAHIDGFNTAIARLSFNGFSGGINALVLEALAWFSYTGGDFFTVLASPTHIALVSDASGNGQMRMYLAGTQVAIYNSGPVTKVSPYTGSVTLGGISSASATLKFKGVRVRHAQMYTGTTFTPPTSPAAWGPP